MTIAFIKLIPMLHRLHSASHYKVKRNKVVIEEIDIIDITIEVSLLDFIVWLFFISAALLDCQFAGRLDRSPWNLFALLLYSLHRRRYLHRLPLTLLRPFYAFTESKPLKNIAFTAHTHPGEQSAYKETFSP